MTTSRFVLVALVPLLVAAATAKTATYSERVAAHRAQAMAEREKLKQAGQFQLKAVYDRYPTPEIKLVAATPPTIAPGAVVKIAADATQLDKKALVLFDCDDLDVLSLKRTRKGVEAKVRARATMLADSRTCRLVALQPVSMATGAVEAVKVTMKWRWKLELADGTQIDLETGTSPDLSFASTWTQAGIAETHQLQLEGGRMQVGRLRFRAGLSDEDKSANDDAWSQDPARAEHEQLVAEKQRLEQEAAEQCAQEPGQNRKRAQCTAQRNRAIHTQLGPRLQASEAQRQRLLGRHNHSCGVLDLVVAEDGGVTGQGLGCGAADGAIDVKGKVAAAPL